ncbi:MAG: single-stranded-DNA-specific exonuclease RecJ [Aminipila sp.]
MNKINPIIIELLKKRGISGDAEILEFLSDKPQKTYDPFLLHDLEAGVDLILSAINNKKKICIYGDYDADGVTSVSILMQFFSNFDADITYYIPSRFDEGYGLNKGAIDYIKNIGTDLIITVDCGSVSCDEVEHAKEIGLEIIVTDHHSIADNAADCILINPKHPNCKYPFKYLAGCGVAFKLAQGIQRKSGISKRAVNELLDLVAIGTIGDIVPLVDENRTLVKYGMNVIKDGHRLGLSKLINGISLNSKLIKSDNVAFGIVPHLNAAGRMKAAKIGVDLMNCKEINQIDVIVEDLIHNNRNRKRVQEDTFAECDRIIQTLHKDDLFYIVNCEEAHEGIAGIVAGKLKDKYHRPTIILTPTGEGFLKGTGRSISKINLYNVLKEQEDLFERFGGHSGACGLLMQEEKLPIFRSAIADSMKMLLESDPSAFDDDKEADIVLEGKEITFDFIRDIEKLAPFGSCNERPYIALEEVVIAKVQYMGSEGKHAKFSACCRDGSVIQSVFFNRAEEFKDKLFSNSPLRLLGSPEISEWNGNKRIQFLVSDIK